MIISLLKTLKRRILNWRGDGVHSPFAFNLIRNVIRQPHPYNAYRLLYSNEEAERINEGASKSKLWTKRKYLELIFRITHHHKAQACYLEGDPKSLVLKYIHATGYGAMCSDIKQADTIILEHATPKDFTLSEQQKENLWILINTNNPQVKQWAEQMKETLNPPIVFNIVGMDIWIWRTATTPGYYPVYY